MAELVVSAYRFTHPDGSSKDWAIAHDAAGVRIFYGKTGGRLRTADVPAVRCRRQSPATEALTRIREQERQGYHGLGRFRFDGSSRRLLGPVRETAEPVAPAAPVPAAPRLYWERRPRGPRAMAATPTPTALPALGEAASAILQTLHHHGLIEDYRGSGDAGAWRIHLHLAEGQTWSFGVVAPGADPADGLDATGRGQGSVPLDPPAPAVFLLALARHDPDLLVADETGAVLVQPPAPLALETGLAVALGLIPPPLRELLAAVPAPVEWFY